MHIEPERVCVDVSGGFASGWEDVVLNQDVMAGEIDADQKRKPNGARNKPRPAWRFSRIRRFTT